MDDLVGAAVPSPETPERDRGKEALRQLSCDRMPGKNGKPPSGKQRLFDRFRAAELHRRTERVFRPAPLARKETRERPQCAGAAFARDESPACEIFDVDGLSARRRLRHTAIAAFET